MRILLVAALLMLTGCATVAPRYDCAAEVRALREEVKQWRDQDAAMIREIHGWFHPINVMPYDNLRIETWIWQTPAPYLTVPVVRP